MHFVHLTSVLIATLQFEQAICHQTKSTGSERIPAPVLFCDLAMYETEGLTEKRVNKGKRPVPRRKEVIEDAFHEAIGGATNRPIKEPHASGTYEYDESNSSTSSDDASASQVVVEPNHAEVHSGDGNFGDQQIPTPEGIDEENEHQQADGEIEYSMCEESATAKEPVLRKDSIANLA